MDETGAATAKRASVLSEAVTLREAGRYEEAESLLRQHLAAYPDDAEALAIFGHIQGLLQRPAQESEAIERAGLLSQDSPVVQRNLARLRLKQGRLFEAKTAAQVALDCNPEDRESLLVMAAVLGADGNTAAALQQTERALSQAPDYAEALVMRALLQLRLGRSESAITDVKRALECKPHLGHGWQVLANLYSQAGKHELSLGAMAEGVRANPNNIDLLTALAERYYRTGHYVQAEPLLRRAVKLSSESAKSYFNLGLVCHAQGNFAEAIECYQHTLKISPEMVDAHNSLGATFQAQGKLAEAITQFEHALVINPVSVEAHNNLAVVYKMQHKFDNAIFHYQRALAINPDSAEAHNNIGNVFKQLERFEDALLHYNKALALQPNNVEVHKNIGAALRQMGSLDEAVGHYWRALALKPNDDETHNNLGVALKEQGKLADALEEYQAALKLKARNPATYNNIGSLFYEQGNLDDAIVHYRRALELDSDFGEAHDNLGRVLQKMRKFDEARTAFERALQLLPEKPDPALNLCMAIYGVSQEEKPRAVELALGARQLYPENELLKRGLAGILEVDVDAADERQYIKAVFDTFADSFDKTLESLGYDMPYQLADKLGLLEGKEQQPQFDILDAGCGTGLCGKYLRPVARSLIGVDLSAKMLAKARALSLYDQLVEGDVVDFMRSSAGAFDMVVSSDVLPYIGDLNELMTAASVALRDGGLFAASVESLDHEGEVGNFRLAPSGRYQHSKRYLEQVLCHARFNVRKVVESVGRLEWGRPVKAWIVIGEKLNLLSTEAGKS